MGRNIVKTLLGHIPPGVTLTFRTAKSSAWDLRLLSITTVPRLNLHFACLKRCFSARFKPAHMVWTHHHVLMCHSAIFSGEASVQIFCFLTGLSACLVLTSKSPLYIPVSLLTGIITHKYFLPISSLTFYFFFSSVFDAVKLFNLVKFSHLSMNHAFSLISNGFT